MVQDIGRLRELYPANWRALVSRAGVV